MRISDWSSDVCSSDLPERRHVERLPGEGSGTRRRPATYIMHNRLIQKLASDIASSASEDQLYGALSSTASRLGFDHFALAYDRRGASGPSSEEHTSELQSLMRISYAVFCLKKK